MRLNKHKNKTHTQEKRNKIMPSSNVTVHSIFNGHFFEFLEYISAVHPSNLDILNAIDSFRFFRKQNPTILMKAWFNYVFIPYKDVIDRGDFSFFCDKDYAGDLAVLGSSNKNIIEIIDRIREPIRNMTPEQQTRAVRFLQTLTSISQMNNR